MTTREHVGVWEWSEHDLDSLMWPEQNGPRPSGLLARHEQRLQRLPSATVKVRTVPSTSARQAFESVRELRRLARSRGDEQLEELDEMLALAFGIMSWLLRCAIPLSSESTMVLEVESDLREIGRVGRESLFLSEAEKAALNTAGETLHVFLSELLRENPKCAELRELLSANPSLTVVCPDSRLHGDLTVMLADCCASVVYTSKEEDADLAGVVIPGWFRKERMADLLTPPVASPLFLILYEIEREWYSAYRREGQTSRRERRFRSNRAQIFPAVPGWGRKEDQDTPPEDEPQSGLRDLEAIQQYVQSGYRQRVYKSARSDGTENELPARLVLFEGPMHAFLTETYRANAVTHLLDAVTEEQAQKADIKQLPISQLSPGDAILFRRGSERDVVRAAADQILPPGIRDLSSLWRRALTRYATENSFDSATVWKSLRAAGCPLQHQTIKIWLDSEELIAPQSYTRDVGIIAQVTGDLDLSRRIDDVLAAISEVRSAHLRASSQLAKKIIAQAVLLIRQERQHSPLIEIETNVVMARIVEIDDHKVPVRTSLVNRLLEGEQ